MKAIVLIINLLWLIDFMANAQCDRTLVQKATEKAGNDAVLVRDFKVKLKDGDKRNPLPSSRFTVLMQKGITYRYNVAGAMENPELAVLQLYDKSNLLGSTFDIEKGQDVGSFQYLCQRTGDYQVVLFFRNSKAGCAAGVMSMVVDSAFLSSHQRSDDSDDEELYLGIDNKLTVSADSLGNDKLEVTADNGVVTEHETHFIIRVDRGTSAKVTVRQKGPDGKIVEETVKEFKVLPLPEPEVHLGNNKDAYLNTFEVGTLSRLDIKPGVYRIVEFYTSRFRVPHSGFRSEGDFLSSDQREFLKSLKVNDKFYVNDIKVEKPDGTIIELASQEYYIR